MHNRFSEQWLQTLCGNLSGVHSAVFMVPDVSTNQMHELAQWPRKSVVDADFQEVVKYALKKQSEVCLAEADNPGGQVLDYFAKPIYIQSNLAGVLAIKIDRSPTAEHPEIFQSLSNSVEWLGLASFYNPQSGRDEFYSDVVGMLASSFEQGSYHQGLMRLVADLTVKFNCERVAFGELQGHHCRVIALSNSAEFDHRSNLVRKIADVMDEAVEQDSTIRFPNEKSKVIQRAHQDFARKFGSGSIATIPLSHEGKIRGAVTLLCSQESPLDDQSIDFCHQTFSLLTPFMALKKEQERNIFSKFAVSLASGTRALLGFKHLRAKFATLLLGAFIAFACMLQADFRVTANAVLEGKVQRVVAAPIAGFLMGAYVRAGDTIRQGDVMASLDDSELKLELTRLKGRLQKSRREYREVQSARDLVGVRVIKEQINQINAEIDLVMLQLASINLTAPFDGVIIEGDLSQLLGSPVERGDALFKIAPLEGYRIILKVHESDIAYVEQGLEGALTLSSFSETTYPLRVERITSVAKAADGANIFRVEASLPHAPDLLRPGMEGIGKISAGREPLVWIWTREIVNKLRLWVWSWWL